MNKYDIKQKSSRKKSSKKNFPFEEYGKNVIFLNRFFDPDTSAEISKSNKHKLVKIHYVVVFYMYFTCSKGKFSIFTG